VLTNKTRYGLKALLYLTLQHGNGLVTIQTIASANCIPKKFLDMILLELRRGGLLRAKKGKAGGYSLARPPDLITFGEAIRLLDRPLAPLACASHSNYQPCGDCPEPKACITRKLMSEVRDAISDILDKRSLAEICAATSIQEDAPTTPGVDIEITK
jgi:Rrf2 family protein